jgi:hypothetical protein
MSPTVNMWRTMITMTRPPAMKAETWRAFFHCGGLVASGPIQCHRITNGKASTNLSSAKVAATTDSRTPGPAVNIQMVVHRWATGS